MKNKLYRVLRLSELPKCKDACPSGNLYVVILTTMKGMIFPIRFGRLKHSLRNKREKTWILAHSVIRVVFFFSNGHDEWSIIMLYSFLIGSLNLYCVTLSP